MESSANIITASVTSQITSRIKMDTLLYRRGGSAGYWTVFMLPLAIYLADLKYSGQSFPAVIIIVHNSLLLSLFHFGNYNLPRLFHKLKPLYFVLSLVILFYCWYRGGVFYEYTSYVILNFSFPYVFLNLIRHYPHSFTFGEAMLVTSAFIYNFWAASQNLVIASFAALQDSPEPVIITLIIELAFFGVLLLSRILLMLAKPWKYYFLEEVFCIWTKGTLVNFTYKLSNIAEDITFLVYWMLEFLLGSKARLFFLGGWVGCVMLGAWFLSFKNSSENLTTTVDRKFFHLLVCVVFLPAVFKDYNLIYFCSAIVMMVFLVVEATRVLQLTILGFNLGEVIDSCVSRFRDSRDEGKLILTPIYLLAGCSMPIWLTGMYYENSNNSLTAEEMAGALSGILSIGVGDTFASIGGYYIGRTRWKGTNKTLEGTFCSFMSQIMFVVLLCLMDVMPFTGVSVFALCLAAVVNALVEAWTDQIDNIVLPLVTFNCIYAVKLISEKLQS